MGLSDISHYVLISRRQNTTKSPSGETWIGTNWVIRQEFEMDTNLTDMSHSSSFGRLSGLEMSRPATILNGYQGDVSPSPRVPLFHTPPTAEPAARPGGDPDAYSGIADANYSLNLAVMSDLRSETTQNATIL
jgi:hypothetical protein